MFSKGVKDCDYCPPVIKRGNGFIDEFLVKTSIWGCSWISITFHYTGWQYVKICKNHSFAMFRHGFRPPWHPALSECTSNVPSRCMTRCIALNVSALEVTKPYENINMTVCVCQSRRTLVKIKVAGKWLFIPIKFI